MSDPFILRPTIAVTNPPPKKPSAVGSDLAVSIAIAEDPEWGDVPPMIRRLRVEHCTVDGPVDALRSEDV